MNGTDEGVAADAPDDTLFTTGRAIGEDD